MIERQTDFVMQEGGDWRFTLLEDLSLRLPGYRLGNHAFRDGEGREWLVFAGDVLTVRKGYSWDGSSPKFRIAGVWTGTPDFLGTRLGSMVHDACYQFLHLDCFPLRRPDCDRLFGAIMRAEDCRWWWIYSRAVLVFGGIHYGVGSLLGRRREGHCETWRALA